MASNARTIYEATKLATEPVATSPPDADEPPPTPAPALSETRKARLQSIFDLFVGLPGAKGRSGAISLATLEEDCSSKLGPHNVSLLKELKMMDADGDGDLTFDEMCGYFRAVGAELDDDEFEVIASDLMDRGSAAQVVKLVEGA